MLESAYTLKQHCNIIGHTVHDREETFYRAAVPFKLLAGGACASGEGCYEHYTLRSSRCAC